MPVPAFPTTSPGPAYPHLPPERRTRTTAHTFPPAAYLLHRRALSDYLPVSTSWTALFTCRTCLTTSGRAAACALAMHSEKNGGRLPATTNMNFPQRSRQCLFAVPTHHHPGRLPGTPHHTHLPPGHFSLRCFGHAKAPLSGRDWHLRATFRRAGGRACAFVNAFPTKRELPR